MTPIRVALSGSGFKFPAHVGALCAIADCGYEVIEIAGTSGGSIVASLFATGAHLDDLKLLALTHDWTDMLSLSLGSLFSRQGYCDGDNLLNWIDEQTGGKLFAESDIPLIIMSSDISNTQPFRWARDTTPDAKIATASRASASIPFVYEPLIYQGIIHMDGGMANNLPVMQLTQDSVLRVGIELTAKGSPLAPGNIPDTPLLTGRMLDVLMDSAESTQAMFSAHSGAIIVRVETGYASGLDRSMALGIRTRLFTEGYNSTMEALKP